MHSVGNHRYSLHMKVKVIDAQLSPTLCDCIDCSLPGSSVHGVFQSRILERVASSFSRPSSRPRDRTQVSHIAGRCFTIWTTREAHPSCMSIYFKSVYICRQILDWPESCSEFSNFLANPVTTIFDFQISSELNLYLLKISWKCCLILFSLNSSSKYLLNIFQSGFGHMTPQKLFGKLVTSNIHFSKFYHKLRNLILLFYLREALIQLNNPFFLLHGLWLTVCMCAC